MLCSQVIMCDWLPKQAASSCMVCTGMKKCSESSVAIISTFDREIMPRKTFHSPCERFYWYPPRGYEWSSLLVFYSLLHPVLMGISRDSTNSEGCSVLSFTENEIIFLNCSQSVRLSLLGGSGSIPLTASCQTAVSENAPPSLGCSLLFQPLLISAYISAEHEVAAQHINSLVTGWVMGLELNILLLKEYETMRLPVFFWVVSLQRKHFAKD